MKEVEEFTYVPFDIQLEDIIVQKIRTERSAIPIPKKHELHLNVVGASVEHAFRKAAVIVEVQIDEAPDEIFVAVMATFRYKDTDEERVVELVKGGLFNIILPYIRELIHHLCLRMQIEPIIIALIGQATREDKEDKE